ncbi:hypothetical protein BJV82DRAFT_595264 [Fennellomyces sp. T-0311]|nr:hypothetical protein BJV82DRAFT_595264 [Fennellomyces sp. T-0311]
MLRPNPKPPVSYPSPYYLILGNKQIYSAKTNVFWGYKQELVNRRKFRIEQEYDLLRNNSAEVSESADFARHIFVLSVIRTRIKRRRALTLAGNRGRKVKGSVDEAGVFLHPQADSEQGQGRNTESCNAATSLLTGEFFIFIVVCRQRQEHNVQYEMHWDSMHAYGWSPQSPPKCSCTATHENERN